MGHPEEAYLDPDPLEELHLEVQPDHLGEVPEEPHDDAHARSQSLRDQKHGPFQEEAYPLLLEAAVVVHPHRGPFPPFLVGEEAYPLLVEAAVEHRQTFRPYLLGAYPHAPYLLEEAYPHQVP